MHQPDAAIAAAIGGATRIEAGLLAKGFSTHPPRGLCWPLGALVAREEAELRAQVNAEGGRWNPEWQVWKLRYARVKRPGLEGHLIRDTPDDYEVFEYDVGGEG